MDWYFGNIWYLLLFLLLPLLGILMVRFLKWRKNKQAQFADSRFRDILFAKPSKISKAFAMLYLLAFGFLVISIVDILVGSEEVEVQQKVNSVLFTLDVSNSMNTEDVDPDRLTLAKNLIINTVPGLKSNKIGFVIFAGEATSIMPLTSDFSAIDTYVQGIETTIMKVQGTDFLNAVQQAAIKLKNIPKGSRTMVMISDGEDNEGNTEEAIKFAKSEGITIITVGVGTEEGGPIPEYLLGQLMGYKSDMMTGETIISKRQVEALKEIASKTGGEYIDGNNLDQAVQQIISAVNKYGNGTNTKVKSNNAIHYYQYFLVVSLLLFFIIYLFNPKKDLNI